MKTYQYLEKPYVSPINLDVLNTTFSNLETMHQKAVQTGSELKAAIAKLPLNEAEEGFRDNLYAQIQQTIDQNTIHGNLAAGYDDLVKYQGELLTNKALVGRINAQAEYLKTKDYIDKFDISESGREMYRALNPYHYEDKVDENGNVVGGTTWTPKVLPTKVIDLNTLIIQGINLAAKEEGFSHTAQWLDENGNPTTDPFKAFDGQIYNEITRQWERLGHDKIKKAIYSVIENNPYAKKSLNQDYMIAKWEFSTKGIDNGITNIDGSIKSEEEYLEYRIDPAAQVAFYNREINKTTWGPGFASYKKAERDAIEATIKAEKEKETSNLLNDLSTGGRGGSIHVSTSGEKVRQNKNILYNEILTNLKRIGVSDADINKLGNNYNVLNKYIDNIIRTPDNLNVLNETNILLKQYKKYDSIYDSLINDSEGKEFVDMYYKINSGEKLTNDGSLQQIEFVKLINEYISAFEENPQFSFDNNEIFNITYNGNTIASGGYNTSKYKDSYGNPKAIDLNKLTTNDLIEYVNTFNGIYSYYDPNLNITYDQYEDVINRGRKILNYYNEIMGYASKYNNIDIPINYDSINTIELLEGDTFGQNILLKEYKCGNIDATTYNTMSKDHTKDVINKIKSTNFANHLLYCGINDTTLELVNQKDILTHANNIRDALDTGNYVISPAHVANLNDPITNTLGGYYITINPRVTTTTQTKDNEKELVQLVEDQNTYKYYISGIGLEDVRDLLMSDETLQLNNFYQIIGDTKSSYTIYDTYGNDSPLGDITIRGVDDSNFVMDFFGDSYRIDKKSAIELTKGCELISSIKYNLQAYNMSLDDYLENFIENEGKEKMKYLSTSISNLCDNISKITGQPVKNISSLIGAELSNTSNNNIIE